MVDLKNDKNIAWSLRFPEEKKPEFFLRQKELLDTFLSTGAIDKSQYDKSLNCLIEKMGIGTEQNKKSGKIFPAAKSN